MPGHRTTHGDLDVPASGDPDLDWGVVGPDLDWDVPPVEPPLPEPADVLTAASRAELDEVEAVLGAARHESGSEASAEREQVLVTLRALREVVADLPGATALGRVEVALQRLWDEPGFRRPLLSQAASGAASAARPVAVDAPEVGSAPVPAVALGVEPVVIAASEHDAAVTVLPDAPVVELADTDPADEVPAAVAPPADPHEPVDVAQLLPDVEPEPALRSSLAAAAAVPTVRAAAAPVGVDASGRVLPVPAAPEPPQPAARPKRGLRLPVGRAGASRRGKS